MRDACSPVARAGLREKPYENALCVSLRQKGVQFHQQRAYPIIYESVVVGECISDPTIGDVILDVKAIDQIAENEVGQMLNYLHIAEKSVGLIVHFKNVKLEWKRVVK